MKLKEIMINQDIRQNKLAKDLNISTTSLNNYCNNKTEPDIATLIKFADYFNISLDYLCGRQWNNKIGYIPDEKKDVVKLILQLNEQNTLKTFGYVSGLLAGQN